MPEQKFRSGYVALIGRPNAGKSTLLNQLVGEKIAAVSNKPQTTRNRIQGIVNTPSAQVVFVDTPGVHKPGFQLNRRMMTAVHDAIMSVDVIVLMRDASVSTGNGDRFVFELVKKAEKPTILALNKIDKVKTKGDLLPLIEQYSAEFEFAEVLPISAKNSNSAYELLNNIIAHLPESEPVYGEDEMTDQSMRTIAAEMVREKILASTGDEIPYVTAVITEVFYESDPAIVRIYCTIFVERDSQKRIVIGKQGARLKDVGTKARLDIEQLLGRKVFLKLFVKVVADWRNNDRTLDELGLDRAK